MQSAAVIRLMNDWKNIRTEPPEGCSSSPLSDDNLFVWEATIFGPADSPWEGGVFSLRLTFSEQYPEKPPRIKFITEVFHPNVYPDGALCLDIIQDHWSPIYNVSSILTSVQSLLTDPNTQSPANVHAAELYNNDRDAYNKRVRKCSLRSLDD
eukprot:GFYU01003009.1.p1 GENE.GFYU01003009.1~~GFYU01003009.1.p1  ORF type:complete len:153 (+),score=31.56 GFYU01003009.1:129-587(+)